MLDAFIGQRFWRGAIVFGAGTRTARYRLSDSFHVREIDLLFETIRRSLSWLDAHAGKKAPEWEEVGDAAAAAAPAAKLPELRFRLVPHAEAMDFLPAILDIEYQVYEPARRTPPAEIRAAIEDAEGALMVVESPAPGDGGHWQLVGFAIGAPLEQCKDVEGPDDDPMLGKHNTMYSVSITVAPGLPERRHRPQAQGGAAARRAWRASAPTARRATATSPAATASAAPPQMTHLNRVFGAHVVSVLTGQYEDPEGQAIYYRIPLGPIVPDPVVKQDVVRRRAAARAGELGDRPPRATSTSRRA